MANIKDFAIILLISLFNINVSSAAVECRGTVLYFCTGAATDVFDIDTITNKETTESLIFLNHQVSGFTNEVLLKFTALTSISFQNNGITSSFFNANVFKGVNLNELVITGSAIVFDEHFANVVNDLHLLQTLNLEENPIVNFHPAAITTFDRLSKFTFTEDNIMCDCDLSWFRNYLLNRPGPFIQLTAIDCPAGGGAVHPITESNFCSISPGTDLTCLSCNVQGTNEDCNMAATEQICDSRQLSPVCTSTISVRRGVTTIVKGCANTCSGTASNQGTCYGDNPNRCSFCCRGIRCNEPETAVLDNYYPPGYPWTPEIITTTVLSTTKQMTTTTITTQAPTTTVVSTTQVPTTMTESTTTLPTTPLQTTTFTTTKPTTLMPSTTLATTEPTTALITTKPMTTTTATTQAPTTTTAPTTQAPTTLPTTEPITTVNTTPLQTTASTTLMLTTLLTTSVTTHVPTTPVVTTTVPSTTVATTPFVISSTLSMTTLGLTTPVGTTSPQTTHPTTQQPTTMLTTNATTSPLTSVVTTAPVTTLLTTIMATTETSLTTPEITTAQDTPTVRTTALKTTARTTVPSSTPVVTTETSTTSLPSTTRSSLVTTARATSLSSSTDAATTTTSATSKSSTRSATTTTATTPMVTTPKVLYCEEERSIGEYGEAEWPSTRAGLTAIVECPVDFGGVKNNASRHCSMDRSINDRHIAVWSRANFSLCPTVHEGLEVLSRENITAENIVVVTEELAQLTNVSMTLQEADVENAVIVLEGVLMHLDEPEQNETEEVLENIIATIEHLSQVEDKHLLMAQRRANTSARIIEAVEETVMTVEIEGDSYSSSSEVLDVTILSIDEETTDEDVMFPIPATQSDSESEDGEKDEAETASLPLTNITIPRTVIANASRVQFVLYKDTSLFQTLTETNNTLRKRNCSSGEVCLRQSGALGSLVISASLDNRKVSNLDVPIVTRFYHTAGTGEKEITNNSRCVFWDFDAANGRGDWSSEGCTVSTTTENFTTCHCDHLTNFAVLLDIYQNVEEIPEEHNRIITFISVGGTALSFFSLLLALASYSCAGKLRGDKRIKVLLNLIVALLIMNMAFLFDVMVSEFSKESLQEDVKESRRESPDYLCFGAAVAMHYSLLCVMTWMAVEAFTMYLALVRVFDSKRSHFMVKMALLGWGLPVLIVGASIGINMNNYGYYNNLCYLDRIPFYITFFVPVCIVLLWNSIVYVLVIRQMHSLRKRQTRLNQTFSVYDQLKASFSLTFLLGLTWLFAFFAFGELNLVFSYLFAIFNALQGFIVFLFHCVLKKEIRRQWQALCCPCIPLLKEGEDGTYTRSRSGTNTSNNVRVSRNVLLPDEVQLREHEGSGGTRSRSWFWQRRRRSDVESTSTNMTRISAAHSDYSPASTINRNLRETDFSPINLFPRDTDFSPVSTFNGRHIPIDNEFATSVIS